MTKYVLTIVDRETGTAKCLVTRFTETVDEFKDNLNENEALFVNEYESDDK